MGAANFSRDVLEMFYGSIEGNQGLPTPIDPYISGFKIVRNNFKEWARVWRMPAKKKTTKTCLNSFKRRKINL